MRRQSQSTRRRNEPALNKIGNSGDGTSCVSFQHPLPLCPGDREFWHTAMPLTTNLIVSSARRRRCGARRASRRRATLRTRVAKDRLTRKLVAARRYPCFFALAQANNQLAHRNKKLRLTRGDRDCKHAPEADEPRVNFSGRPARPVAFFDRSAALAASIWIVVPTPQRCRHLFIRTLYNDGY